MSLVFEVLAAAGEAREVLVPGERGHRSEAERAASGIPLGPKVWRELTEIAAASAWTSRHSSAEPVARLPSLEG
jgi:LDH2 family malate/lactate/ureidoglycolate dehydrogenase